MCFARLLTAMAKDAEAASPIALINNNNNPAAGWIIIIIQQSQHTAVSIRLSTILIENCNDPTYSSS